MVRGVGPRRVALVCMPFAPITRPSLGLSLLRAEIGAVGVECDIHYLNLRFASQLSLANYNAITELSPPELLLGDWVFSGAVHGKVKSRVESYLSKVLCNTFPDHRGGALSAKALQARGCVDPFLDRSIRTIDWSRYAVVGLSTAVQQTCASLALAKRLKSDLPNLVIVLGGPSCEGDMGQALLESYPFVDFVCSGEADLSFPKLLLQVLGRSPVSEMPGVINRHGTRTVSSATQPTIVRDLDALPFPLFDDYFAQLRSAGVDVAFESAIPFEASRGCWWGAAKACLFCNVSGARACYRQKSARRAVDELEFLSSRYGHKVLFADNVLHPNQTRTLFPLLTRRHLRLRIGCEVRADLTINELRVLAKAGVVHVLVGIESLDSSVLGLLRKGTTALQNVQFLKWCRELGIEASWNMLCGVPKSKRASCENVAGLIPLIAHMEPPGSLQRVKIVRFSTYHTNPKDFGLEKMHPATAYPFVYPLRPDVVARIAYYWENERLTEVLHRDLRFLRGQVTSWQQERRAELAATVSKGALGLRDQRDPANPAEWHARKPVGMVYEYCGRIRTEQEVVDYLRRLGYRTGERMAREILEDLVKHGFTIREGRSYLSLGIMGSAYYMTAHK